MRVFKADSIPVRLLWLALLFLIASARLGAAFEELSLPQLRDELKKGLVAGDLIRLRPVLNELSARTDGEPEREGYVFLLGLSYQDEFSVNQEAATLRKAMDYYRQYVDWFPQGTRRAYVRFNLAGAHADLGEFEEAMQHYDWLYRRSKNAVLRQESRDRMCRLYMKHDRAADGVPLFLEVFNAAVLDEELRAQAASWLLQGYLAAGNVDAISPYLRYLTGDTEAVYDPNFNITLLKAGDQLFDEEAYDQAILLYSFVKPKSQIVAFYGALTEKLRKKLSYLSPESDQHTILSGRLQTAESNLSALESVREYEVDMHWRVARVYLETERNWEALWAFYFLYQDYPEHPQREEFAYICFCEARATGNTELTAKLAKAYLGEEGFLKYRNQVTLGLADAYLDSGDEMAFIQLAKGYFNEPEDHLTAAQLINKWALLISAKARYQSLRDEMQPLVTQLAGREPAFEAARYWYALAQLLLAECSAASASFEEFVGDYTDGNSLFAEDANYRYGIALFGEARNADAEAQFLSFIERYPGSRLRGEAELYLGDLKFARGADDQAIEHYGQVDVYTDLQEFISKAVFAISEVHLAAGRGDAAFDVIQDYLERYGDEAYAAQGKYRLGMVRASQGQAVERFRIHSEAIRDLGNDPSRHAVDRLVLGYVSDFTRLDESYAVSIRLLERLIAEPLFCHDFLVDRGFQYRFLQSEEGQRVDASLRHALVRDRAVRATLIESESVTAEAVEYRLREMLEDYEARAEALAIYDAGNFFADLYAESVLESSDKIMELRARMALDELGQIPEGLPAVQDEELQDASPALLLWQADAHLENLPDRAKELYAAVVQRYPFAESAPAALEALAEIALDEARSSDEGTEAWEQALGYYELLAQWTTAGSLSAMPLLRKAEVLVHLGRGAEAIETLGSVLKNPSWRGLDHAKAHLELGKLYMQQEQWREAHGFFERLIVAYGGYLETVAWAYYYDLKTLEALNEAESVELLLAEYRTRIAALRETEAHQRIVDAYDL